MDPKGISRRRMVDQHLIGEPISSIVEAVAWFGAVQAQDYHGAKWGIAQRMAAGTTEAELDKAFDEGKLIRTHVMRPTWHLVRPKDVRWMLELTAGRIQAQTAGRYRRLGLDPKTLGACARVVKKTLDDQGQLTRNELASALDGAGISPEGQRMPHILMYLELEQLICSGARKVKHQTYALLDDRVSATKHLGRKEAIALLALRYFRSHGPATAHDFAWWSGLTVSDAREGVANNDDTLTAEEFDGRTYFSAATSPNPNAKLHSPTIHLLPNWDEYLVAYRDHSPNFDSTRLGGIERNAIGLQRNILTLDGQIIGAWSRTIRKKDVQIEIKPLVKLTSAHRKAIQRAANNYATFAGKPGAEVVGEVP